MAEYYDRVVPAEMEALLESEGPLGWLPSFLRTEPGKLALADIQLRADAKARKRGAIQIYVGSTSTLEVRARASRASGAIDRFALTVSAKTYRRHWRLPDRAITAAELVELRPEIEEYLRRSASVVTDHWVDQESRVHSGLMRWHGLLAPASADFIVFDREVVLGHADGKGRSLVKEELRAMGLSAKGRVSNELDAIAVLTGPEIGLVELKSDERHLLAAADQVAIYLERFERLRRTQKSLEGVRGLVAQKARLALVPRIVTVDQLTNETPFRPIVAMPGKTRGWPDTWRRKLEGHRHALPRLQLWLMSEEGRVRDRVNAWV